jgi:hypothetical protein
MLPVVLDLYSEQGSEKRLGVSLGDATALRLVGAPPERRDVAPTCSAAARRKRRQVTY